MIDEVQQYCDDVLSNHVASGIHLKNAVLRFRKDLERDDIEFREDAFIKVVNCTHKLRHFMGVHSKKYFEMQPWQKFITANIYGFYTKDGTRRFQTAYLEMSRKQGKTAYVAALSLYHLKDDNEDGAEILFAANSLDQSKIGFGMVGGFAHGLDPDEKILKQRFKDIHFEKTNSFIKVLAADSSKLDGYNCSFGVVDEYHSAPNSQVRDVIRSSMGMRENPLLITITTAGFDKSLPCYELRTVCTDILSGTKKDDSFFCVIYSMDENDDWKDPKNWVKSNPNLDITVKSSFLEKQVQQAINSPSDEVGIKTKNFNIWCDTATTWIPDEYIIKSTQKLNFDDFKGETCYIGVDLAAVVDLTAVSYLFEREGIYYFFTDYYIPIDTLKARVHADKELYKEWVQHKFLKTTSGNVTDYDYITHDLLHHHEECDINIIYYDKYNATSWATQATEQGLPLEQFSQTIGNFNIPTREFERLILCGKVVIDDNPITRYCLRNVELRMDFNGNVKPLKNSEKKKIDGVISMLQALAGKMEADRNFKGINIF
jgi:phage terminase large subunit-like protein